jgi:uncharacterized protein (TIGR02996 family)
MSAEPALLAAVAASPDDDLPRLVYADWLDENGRSLRAEFIRLQIEIAKKETLPRAVVNVFSHLWKRQQEILDDHRDELLGPLAHISLHEFEFRRGFLDRIAVKSGDYTPLDNRLGAFIPPPRIAVFGDIRDVDGFVYNTHCHRITDLQIFPLDESGTIYGPAYLTQLVAERAYLFPCLLALSLEGCRISDAGVSMVFNDTFPALRELDLSFNDLTDAGVIALLNTGVPQRLKRLVLGGNPIGDQAAMELADRLGGSKVLENLNLRMTDIGPAGQAALLARLGGKVDLF